MKSSKTDFMTEIFFSSNVFLILRRIKTPSKLGGRKISKISTMVVRELVSFDF